MSILLFLALAFISLNVQARVSTNAPAYFPNYQDLDRLEAYGCVYPTFRQLFPQGDYDLHTSLPVASGDDDEVTCDAPSWLLKERAILQRYPLPNEVRLAVTWVHNDLTPLLGIDAAVTPLLPLRQNRLTFDGPNLYTEINANAETNVGDFGLALSATPGWVGALDEYRYLDGRFYLFEGYIKAGYHWMEATFGRTALRFGETAHGSLLLSAAASPIDLFKLSIRPHLLGSFLDYLGPFTFETFVTPPLHSTFVNNARLWGVQLGIKPFSWFELALMELYQFGGDGVPGLNLSDFLRMLPYGNGSDLDQKRNRAFAAHFSFWLPRHRVRLYTQLMFNNLTAVSDWFSQDISTLVGIWFPRVGATDLRLEFVNTVPGAYMSSIWRQGLTYAQGPIGTPLGPDAQALYLDVGLPAWRDWVPTAGLIYESRGRHPASGAFAENRYGFDLGIRKRWNTVELNAQMVYHLIQNPLYQQAPTASALAALGDLRYTFF